MSFERSDVAIVGGGVAGSALTIALAASAPAGYRATLFDRNEPGPGTAYAPQSPSLLMNGPVRAMSPVAGDARHFARYLVDEPDDALVCRARYGAYVRATVSAALAARRDFRFERDEITDIEELGEGYLLRTKSGRTPLAKNVVLALGNFAPGESFLPESLRMFPGYARDPWRADIASMRDGDVALIGSRLTAMDAVALLDEGAFRGRIHLISRHGLLPHVERPAVRGLDPSTLNLDYSSPYRLLRSLRKAYLRQGGDWRAVVDAIRQVSPSVWQRWSERERRRFLRHLQSMWAIHRYRVPAATHAALMRFHAGGRLHNHAARIEGARESGSNVELLLRSGAGRRSVCVAHVVNCSGPESDIGRVDDELVRNALERGLVRRDSLRLGIDASPRLHVLDANGCERAHLFALGPLLRGLFYESTAVPEIVQHAAEIARALLAPHRIRKRAG